MRTGINRGLPLSGVIWCAAVAAALLAAILKGTDPALVWPYAAMACVPAIIGIVLAPFARREWAQMIIIFAWIALAIIACFAIAYVPMALLFLCAPAAAALFEREKVVEAMLLAAIFAGIVYYAQQNGYAPAPIASAEQGILGQQTGVIATIAFLIGAMFFASSSRATAENAAALTQTESATETSQDIALPELQKQTGNFQDAFPGTALRINRDGKLIGSSHLAQSAFGLRSDADEDTKAVDILSGDESSRRAILGAIESVISSGDASSLVTNAPLGMQGEAAEFIVIDFVPSHTDSDVFAFIKPWENTSGESREIADLRRRAEQEAAEKNLFFAGVSHELRTPLNAIIGFSDMMRSRLFGPLPGKYAEYAELIHDSGQHMLDLIGDVLDLSKVEAGKYELQYDRFDAADVVRSSVKMLRPSADAAQLTFDVDIAVDQDLLIHADRRAVRQILLNLLGNAIKFTPKGGRIKVSAKSVQDVLNISIEDNGLGMSPEELARIGQPYAQGKSAGLVKTRGSGLGLSLVKTLTELHKGRFAVTSHPGAGTNVNIYLPTEKPGPG